jgi:pimeloyl-ACP methyl ester carboxylesterase
LSRSPTDGDDIDLHNRSFGGYLALRGAADPRIKACVAVDSFYDLWDLSAARMPPGFNYLFENGYIGDSVFNWMVQAHGKQDLYTKYQFALAQSMFGTPDAGRTLREMKRYTFKAGEHGGSDYLERIKCPVLVTGAAADPVSFLPEASVNAIVKGLVNVDQRDIEVWMTASYSEGGAQAKSGAWSLLQHRTYRFLDQKLGICRVGSKPLN